jgi:lipopolysaccharide exporter
MQEGPEISAIDINRPRLKALSAHVDRISRYWKNSYWLSSSLFTLLTKATTILFGFLNFLILIRVLAATEYGAWILFISVSTLMELIKHGFIRNPLIRYLSITPESDRPALQTASLSLNVAIAFIQGIVLVGFAYLLSSFWSVPELHNLFLIYILTTFAFIPANHFDTVQQAGGQFRALFFVNMLKQAGIFVYVMFAFLTGARVTLEALAIAQLAGVVSSGILSFIMSRQLLHFSRKVDRRWLRELFDYGKYTFGTNVSSMIIKNMDSWMLGRLLSVHAVTMFNPAIRLTNLAEVPNDTLSTVYFPKVSKEVAEEGSTAIKRRYEMAVGSILALVIPGIAFIIIFAPYIVGLIAGPGFRETVPIVRVTMLYGLLLPFNRFFGVTLDAIGKAKVNFRIVLLTAMLNLVNSYLFISNFGTIGAAYGLLLTYTIMLIVNQVYLYRHFGITVTGVFTRMMEFYRSIPGRLNGRHNTGPHT